jgi:hypothetical protein
MTDSAPDERREHERWAKEINGVAWELLEQDGRDEEEDERLILAAHASYYHWLHAGTNLHRQRGEWMLAHVYTVLGREEPAGHHARRCMAYTERFRTEMEDFDLAYAEEAVARAAALAGDAETARRHRQVAEALGARIGDEEDRTIFLGDLQRGPWFGA